MVIAINFRIFAIKFFFELPIIHLYYFILHKNINFSRMICGAIRSISRLFDQVAFKLQTTQSIISQHYIKSIKQTFKYSLKYFDHKTKLIISVTIYIANSR